MPLASGRLLHTHPEGVLLEVAQSPGDGLVKRLEGRGACPIVATRPQHTHRLRDRESEVVAGDDLGRLAVLRDAHHRVLVDLPSARTVDLDAVRVIITCPDPCSEQTAEVGRGDPEDRGGLSGRIPLLVETGRCERETSGPFSAPRGSPCREERFSGRRVSTAEEQGELGRVDLARPPEHPAARSEPGGVGVVGDGAALGRGELDEGARTAPASDRALAFQVLDDALADQRERRAVDRAEDGDRENHREDGKEKALRTRCERSAKGAEPPQVSAEGRNLQRCLTRTRST